MSNGNQEGNKEGGKKMVHSEGKNDGKMRIEMKEVEERVMQKRG